MASHYAERLAQITDALAAIERRLGISSAAAQQHLTDHTANTAALLPTAPAVASQSTAPVVDSLEASQLATGAPGS